MLAELPYGEDDNMQLWAEVTEDALISNASLLYIDSSGKEVFNYAVTPQSIEQYSLEETPLDTQDIMELRRDVAQGYWDEKLSQKCASDVMFFS